MENTEANSDAVKSSSEKSTDKFYGRIPLDQGLWAIVDLEWVDRLRKYKWQAEVFHSSTYAVADITVRGHKKKLRMHRLVAGTPPGKITHHINHITLDNRRENLLNLTSEEHTKLHSRSRIRIKYAKNTTIMRRPPVTPVIHNDSNDKR